MKLTNLKLDKNSKIPLYIQLFEFFKENIINGTISDGERLPSRRRLMTELSLSKITVEQTYGLLEREGYLLPKAKSGYFARSESPVNKDIDEPNYYYDESNVLIMSHQLTNPESYPIKEISKLYRDAAYDMPELLNFGHKFGEEALRKAISENLNSLHGFGCSPGRIIIGAGTEYLIEQLAHIMPKDTVFGFENACFARSYIPVKNSGSKIALIENELEVFPVEKLVRSNIDIIYLSPDGSYPTNHRMTAEERKAVLNWAYEKENRYIIEADFDLDISNSKTESLFAMDKKDKVIFIGTFAKSIAPSLKTVYIVLPKNIKEAFNKALPYYTNLSSKLEQQTIAKYIQSGKYVGHCQHLRKYYSEKRSLLIKELNSSPLKNHIKIFNSQGGTYFIISVNNGMKEPELKAAAYKNGVKILPLSANFIKSQSFPQNLFLAGFGYLSCDEIKNAVKRLTKAWLP
ncbi:MAG: PLP-dependent aminotransferase family protein [Clostridiales bacterium]|nr:PLP-dependent aminotransferase family protein [Clostridiales bacterium]